MYKSYKYRLYPNSKQIELLNKHFGSVRFVYNLALETKQLAYAGNKINLSCFDLMNQLPDLKKDLTWLKEVSAKSLQASITNLDTAYTNFFKNQGRYPKFKNKKAKQSFKINQSVKLENNKLIIPKFQEGIHITIDRQCKGTIKSATVSKTPSGKFYVSILCDTLGVLPEKALIAKETTIGLDLGIKTFITLSNGIQYENPKYLKKALDKLKHIQSKYSRFKGKINKLKLQKLHEKVANQRRDFLQKISTDIIKNHDSICIENLDVAGMLQNHNLAQSVQDCGWGMFVDMLKYKSEWYGKNILEIGRFEPSSKLCNNCGYYYKNLTLDIRSWICPTCNSEHDRDINAAINIRNFGLRNKKKEKAVSGMDTKNCGELPTLVGVKIRKPSK